MITDQQIVYLAENAFRWNSWTLPLTAIQLIGFVNGLVGDDDTDVLVFVDDKAQLYCIAVCSDHHELDNLLKERFQLNLPEQITDADMVLFPPHLQGRPLYDQGLLQKIKRKLGFHKNLEGNLSPEILAYLLSLNTKDQAYGT